MSQNNSSTDKILSHKLFLQREYSISHLPYEREMDFYSTVKNGDIKKLDKIMLPLKNEQLGKLSENPIRNLKYHLTITVAMITRFCIEGGLPAETAYTLSDVYIQQLDTLRTEDEITMLHHKLIYEYANRMRRIKKQKNYSPHVLKAMDYIYDHLHEKIKLEDVADAIGLHKNYLCNLFKTETHITVGNYIIQRKIEAAANMLIYADYTPLAISNYFAFSSHSHFINTFKKVTGLTPNEYRKQNYNRHFSDAD